MIRTFSTFQFQMNKNCCSILHSPIVFVKLYLFECNSMFYFTKTYLIITLYHSALIKKQSDSNSLPLSDERTFCKLSISVYVMQFVSREFVDIKEHIKFIFSSMLKFKDISRISILRIDFSVAVIN